MAENPYAAPRSRVEDTPTTLPDGPFIPEGRGVPAGNGWRWIADAWGFMGDQRWTFVGVFLLLLVLQLAANFVPFVGPLALSLFFPVILGGFVLGCDAMRQGQRFGRLVLLQQQPSLLDHGSGGLLNHGAAVSPKRRSCLGVADRLGNLPNRRCAGNLSRCRDSPPQGPFEPEGPIWPCPA